MIMDGALAGVLAAVVVGRGRAGRAAGRAVGSKRAAIGVVSHQLFELLAQVGAGEQGQVGEALRLEQLLGLCANLAQNICR